jgi:serine protease Do
MVLMLLLSTTAVAQLPDFTGMVEAYGPAVVNVSTKQKSPTARDLKREFRIPDLPEDSPLNDLFRHFFEGVPGGGGTPFNATSLGSGFITSSDGFILTNHHVVAGADEIIVRLNDRREFEAEVIGSDKASDIALLKIEAKGLPIVKTGKSKDLKVGEWVLAIGSPFGFDHSVTAGIVSAKGRSLPRENYVPFIQTDVAINPGNSGGPLFNLEGEVVGVNSQIYSRTGGFMGLSFAVPIEVAMRVAEQLKSDGHVTRGWLGVVIQDVTRDLANSFGMEHPKGALVSEVIPDSPAEKAGIETGDVILSFNGEEIHDSSQLPPLVGASAIKEGASLVLLRKGKEKQIKVNIGELPEEDELASSTSGGGGAINKTVKLLGLKVRDLTNEQRERLEVRGSGVQVTGLQPGPAHEAGIQRGDVIQMINGVQVKNVREFGRIVADLPRGKTVAVLVHRKIGPRFLALDVPKDG